MAGPLRLFGGDGRATRRVLPEMSREPLIPARAAPSCMRQLEVPGSANHLGMPRDTFTVQTALEDNSVRCLKSRSLAVGEGSQIPCVFPAWLGPGVGS